MKKNLVRSILALALTASLPPICAQAQVIISEVDPTGSSTSSYGADWFELKNIGSSPVDITGWEMDDNSSNFLSAAVSLRGVTSIAAGQAVVFLEGNATGTTDATLDSSFESAWFGSSVPSGFTIGNYGGSGVGLSATADAVNIFDSTGTVQAYVSFGASTAGFTFDNEAGVNGTISQLSQVGVDGAFTSFDGAEVGSPGDVAPVPEPATCALFGLGATALLAFRNRRK